VVPVDEPIAREAAFLRRSARVRLPDALVWATARVRSALLVTRDEGFPAGAPEVRHPYRV
jgi:predicted nucleic acid-binding protein